MGTTVVTVGIDSRVKLVGNVRVVRAGSCCVGSGGSARCVLGSEAGLSVAVGVNSRVKFVEDVGVVRAGSPLRLCVAAIASAGLSDMSTSSIHDE